VKKTFKFDDDVPNISLLDDRVVWWNEEYICIDVKKPSNLEETPNSKK
jgi:hypothetical protein